ncbi:MAG: RNA-binding S4 domain-containing protein, partial [Flavobacteriaceae bacterium]
MENDDHVQEDEFSNSDLLYEHFSFKADLGQSPLRVDKFLMSRIENATRNKIQQAAKAGSIHVDGQPVKSNFKIKGGNTVKVLFT